MTLYMFISSHTTTRNYVGLKLYKFLLNLEKFIQFVVNDLIFRCNAVGYGKLFKIKVFAV